MKRPRRTIDSRVISTVGDERPKRDTAAQRFKHTATLLICTFCVYGGSAFMSVRPNGDAVADVAAVTAWQTALERQQALIADNRVAIDAATTVLRGRMADIQTRLVALDAATSALLRAVDVDPEALAADAAASVPEAGAGLTASGSDLASQLEAATSELARRERQLLVLSSLVDRYDAIPRGRPVAEGWISSLYGERTDPLTGEPAYHRGVDIAARAGVPVVAVADGLVTWSGPRSGYGQTVEVTHGNELVTRYAHNSENLAEVGDIVRRGEVIARLGASGRATGPNLHFEVLHARRQVDPSDYME